MSRIRPFVLLVLAVLLTTACGACEAARVASPGTEVSLPVQPVDTTVPVGTGPPPVSDAAHAAGFIDVRTVVPDAVLDLRYATTNNFTHTQLYPSDARCLVHQSMGPGLGKAAASLRAQGHLLVFWDCYRPHDVQVKMYNVVPNPAWV
ncbi:M15 family metallopeptidase, partial [Mycobacterium sp.]|uniref:M15 family metallopeptidase n=1 Tax=Mycobacterium sp. TaxID=1785 RepID=UPI003C763B1C